MSDDTKINKSYLSLANIGHDSYRDEIILDFLDEDGNIQRVLISAKCAEATSAAIIAKMKILDSLSEDPRRRASKTIECHKIESGLRDDGFPILKMNIEAESELIFALTKSASFDLINCALRIQHSLLFEELVRKLPTNQITELKDDDFIPEYPLNDRWFKDAFFDISGMNFFNYDLSDQRTHNIKAIMYRYEYIITDFKKRFGEESEVAFGFTDTNKINAVAISFDLSGSEKGAIAIDVQIYESFRNFFDLILSMPDNFKYIGDPEKERKISKFIPKKLSLGNALLGFPRTHLYPICEHRRYASILFLTVAMDFIFFHEYAHIINGHIGYEIENSLRFRPALKREVNDNQEEFNDSYYNLSQSMEMDADETAIKCAIHYALNNSISDEHIFVDSNIQHNEKIEITLKIALFSILSVWHIIQPYDPNYDYNNKKRSHPPISVRKFYSIEYAIDFISDLGLLDKSYMENEFRSIPSEIDIIIGKISGDPDPCSISPAIEQINSYFQWLRDQRIKYENDWLYKAILRIGFKNNDKNKNLPA